MLSIWTSLKFCRLVKVEERKYVFIEIDILQVLGDSCDLKNLKSMDALERFLKLCNKTAIKEFLGYVFFF